MKLPRLFRRRAAPAPASAAPEIVYFPISEGTLAAATSALRGLDESDPVLGAVLLLLATLHTRLLVAASAPGMERDAVADATLVARGVRAAMREISAATRGEVATVRPRAIGLRVGAGGGGEESVP